MFRVSFTCLWTTIFEVTHCKQYKYIISYIHSETLAFEEHYVPENVVAV